ncbi:hypothetical protein COS77_01275 [Candidatus Roizmanbacteria bacterium CG06_land_8_20_14_3_00_34_14]|uniref:Uncharacterized protein n=2 Tax=Candidatus Roizmaniibacteriota TaxID=1752723 RepID=A0A2M7AVA2_9BACT|nr:MAG: hypothetical protein COT02_02085 [Candidatus Roizmanbacteria bacterium CG07_land_8_20_14_0_80_34_15]PIU74526.1 MAG: hypothetical protein COS77_01275 [Candidatus Roizmanbacteria bacterium CG06_land_8_20_14_3_00_34_14]
MKLNNKKTLILGGVLLVLFIFFSYWILVGSKNTVNKKDEQIVSSDNILPTVDSSVKVNLISTKKGEAVLSINSAPNGTKSIEFEMSYLVVNEDNSEGGGAVSQGAIGKCYEASNVWECGEPSQSGRKIILGTCSSGVCRYHNITGPIRVSLKFSGNYGEKIFTKEYKM